MTRLTEIISKATKVKVNYQVMSFLKWSRYQKCLQFFVLKIFFGRKYYSKYTCGRSNDFISVQQAFVFFGLYLYQYVIIKELFITLLSLWLQRNPKKSHLIYAHMWPKTNWWAACRASANFMPTSLLAHK